MAEYKRVYSSAYNTSRPDPENWQTARDYDAMDRWDDLGRTVDSDLDRAGDIRNETRTGAKSALDKVNTGRSTNVEGYRATNTESFQPTQMGQWLSTLSSSFGSRPTASRASTGSVGSVGGMPSPASSGVRPYEGELAKFDSSDVSDFDPGSYGKEYASGAYGEFQDLLGDELQGLENRSVGAGRLRTGLFDRDQSSIITRLGSDYNNKMAQQSGTFAGQRLDALRSGADLRYRRASDIDTNTLAREAAAQRAAETSAANALRASELQNDYDLGLYDSETKRYGLGIDAARSADEMGYRRASDLDKYGYDRATYLDDQQFARDRTGLDAALMEEGRYIDDYDRTFGRASDYASSSRDWAAADREAQDLRDEVARLRAEQAAGSKTGGGGTRTTASMSPNQQIALKMGVPYVG